MSRNSPSLADTLMKQLPPDSDWQLLSPDSAKRTDQHALLTNQLNLVAALIGFPRGDAVVVQVVAIQRVARGRAVAKIDALRAAAITLQTRFRGHAARASYARLVNTSEERTKIALLARIAQLLDGAAKMKELEEKAGEMDEKLARMQPVLAPGDVIHIYAPERGLVCMNSHGVIIIYAPERGLVRMNSHGDSIQLSIMDENGNPLVHSFARFIVHDAGHNMVALYNKKHRRFVRIHHGSVDGQGGRVATPEDLPSDWHSERFIPVKYRAGIALYNPHAGKYIALSESDANVCISNAPFEFLVYRDEDEE